MTPIIGLTTGKARNAWRHPTKQVPDAYIRAVMEAGGIPLIIPSDLVARSWHDVYPRLDGILFTGGGDIEALRYGGAERLTDREIDAGRDELELRLLEKAMHDGKPFLGICRGCQLINVGLRGTLHQHIPDSLAGSLQHDQPEDRKPTGFHEVQLVDGSRMARMSGQLILTVNSHHHQGVKDLGRGVAAVGRTADGLIEAIEVPDHPFGLAVQWHPEWLPGEAHAKALFREFVEACA